MSLSNLILGVHGIVKAYEDETSAIRDVTSVIQGVIGFCSATSGLVAIAVPVCRFSAVALTALFQRCSWQEAVDYLDGYEDRPAWMSALQLTAKNRIISQIKEHGVGEFSQIALTLEGKVSTLAKIDHEDNIDSFVTQFLKANPLSTNHTIKIEHAKYSRESSQIENRTTSLHREVAWGVAYFSSETKVNVCKMDFMRDIAFICMHSLAKVS